MLWGYGTCLPTKTQLPVSFPSALAPNPPAGSGNRDGSGAGFALVRGCSLGSGLTPGPSALGVGPKDDALGSVGDCVPLGELAACSATQAAAVTTRIARQIATRTNRPDRRSMRRLSAPD